MIVILNRRILVVERKHTRSWNERRMKELARVDLYFRFFRVPRVVSFLLLLRVFLLDDVSDRFSFVSDRAFSREIHHPVRCHRRVIVALDDE